MLEIIGLQERADRFEDAVQAFWSQWGAGNNRKFYEDCMRHSIMPGSDLPSFYLAVDDEAIIGTYALLRNDLISRQDLFPWLACLYVAPAYRGRQIGAQLLRHARQEARLKGYDKLYLSTDLDGYYEKYGWKHMTNGYTYAGDEARIYVYPSSEVR